MKRVYTVILWVCAVGIVSAQSVDQIIENHIEKIGGKEAWSKIKSIHLKGEFITSSGSDKILTISKSGRLLGNKIVEGKRVVQFAFDGEHFWDYDFVKGELTKRNSKISSKAKKEAQEFPLMFVKAKELGYRMELIGEEKIMGEDCYKLKINKGKTFVKGKEVDDEAISFINKDNYLEMLVENRNTRSDHMVYTYYQDYKNVNGILLPFTITWFINEVQLAINVESYVLNAEVDEALFEFEKK
ncbi:outer membrane lipoprotein-sorting protein [Flagellimonas olearia]|uniref:Outer membrane lipoprotein-sorting protein n=1 Tax=Flagellimonas olearia TaxID=552546 RepID=A0A444VI62_9FLAO|nr:outer membrane lipoprotein-sorting protein [Allomuricauda olearia]RYC50433.1 hypothetical protein DN53_05815 [Allomuricauda olearia]